MQSNDEEKKRVVGTNGMCLDFSEKDAAIYFHYEPKDDNPYERRFGQGLVIAWPYAYKQISTVYGLRCFIRYCRNEQIRQQAELKLWKLLTQR